MNYSSVILRLYHKYLVRFLLFRLLKSLTLFGYRLGYQIICLLRSHPEQGTYEWRSLSAVGKDIYSKKQYLLPSTTFDPSPPLFFGHMAETASKLPSTPKFHGLEQSLYEFSPAVAIGGIDAVLTCGKAVHHDLFQAGKHNCPAENTGILSQNPDGKRLHLYLAKDVLTVDKAASMIGQCSNNYAHWLTETLPKLPMFDLSEEHSQWPLLVDAGLHPNIMASIKLLNKNKRQIIEVERWRPVRLNRLQVVSAPGYERYVPQGLHPIEPAPYQNHFSSEALKLLKSSVLDALGVIEQPGKVQLYLGRSEKNINLRQLENSEEIEGILQYLGVQKIFPETMSFSQQINLCSNAELIIAPIGAALANMIFAPRGCRLIILAPYYEEASYFYYTNLAGVLGHKLTFVLGPQVGGDIQPAHRNYSIEVSDLLATL